MVSQLQRSVTRLFNDVACFLGFRSRFHFFRDVTEKSRKAPGCRMSKSIATSCSSTSRIFSILAGFSGPPCEQIHLTLGVRPA